MSMLWAFSIAILTSSFASPETRIGPPVIPPPVIKCERHLGGEFDRRPDDMQNGLVSSSVELTVPNLLAAYRRGIFPWGQSGPHSGEWFSPPWRGVLDLNAIQIGRSDMKFIRRHLNSGEYQVTFDQAFDRVIAECSRVKRFTTDPVTGEKVPSKDWLSDLFIQRYTEMHKAGYAHSVEVWRNGKLVAGLYGVFVDGIYSGESMFHDAEEGSNATKLALYALIERLRANGHQFIDTQMAVGLAGKWGARYVPRGEYQRRLAQAQQLKRPY